MRPATFPQNNPYMMAALNAHRCVLALSNAGARVLRLQIKHTGPVIEVDSGMELARRHCLPLTQDVKQGVHYQKTEFSRLCDRLENNTTH